MLAGPQAQPVDIHRKMPISKGRASLDSAPVGSIEQALLTLKLSAKDPDVVSRLDKVLYTLRDVVSGPNIMMCEDQEALWWEAFAEVFASEVRAGARGPEARGGGGRGKSGGRAVRGGERWSKARRLCFARVG